MNKKELRGLHKKVCPIELKCVRDVYIAEGDEGDNATGTFSNLARVFVVTDGQLREMVIGRQRGETTLKVNRFVVQPLTQIKLRHDNIVKGRRR